MEVPGIGAVKQGVTSATGGALQGIGKFLQNGIGGVGNISNIANGRIGQTLQRGLPFAIGSQAFNQPQQAGMEQSQTDTASQAQTGQANQGTDPRIAQAYQQLVTPVKQGGMGLSNSDAEAYMINVLGVTPPSAQKGAAKTTDGQRKFLAAAENADLAANILAGGKVGTGKGAAAGNFISQLLGNQSSTQTDYNAKLTGARAAARSALSGATVTDQERADLMDLLPTIMDEPNIAKSKLKSFAEAMRIYASPSAT
jgi:hypothetical protein